MSRFHQTTRPFARAGAFAAGFRRLRAVTSPDRTPENPVAAMAAAQELFVRQCVLYAWLPEDLRRHAWMMTSVERVA